MVSACSTEAVEQEPEQAFEAIHFEGSEEKAEMLKEFQDAENEIESVTVHSNISQVLTGNGISEESEVEADYSLLFDSMAGRIESKSSINGEEVHLKMHLDEGAL